LFDVLLYCNDNTLLIVMELQHNYPHCTSVFL